MQYLEAIILAVVEGITEFLPISSTGHLILVTRLLQLPPTEFVKSFSIAIQLGAILAVVFLYWRTLLRRRAIWQRIGVAFIPTALVGLALYPVVKNVLLGNAMITVVALVLGGVVLLVLERFYEEQPHHLDTIEQLTLTQAAVIGLLQAVSIIPGVSRAAATISGGLVVGLKRQPAVEFSFLLAIPTMLAATSLDVVNSYVTFTAQEWGVLAVGFIGAGITAVLAVRYFVRFVERHTFRPFAVYRIVVGVLFWWFILG